MTKLLIFLLFSTILFLCVTVKTVYGDKGELVSFPYEKKPCTGKLLGAVCCQGILVNPINFNKTLCAEFQLKLLPPKADVNIKLDDKTVAEFEIDPKKPPSYCIPVILPVPVSMCIKLHDVKMVSLGLQVCSTIYVNYQTKEVFNHKVPCIKLSSSGIQAMDT